MTKQKPSNNMKDEELIFVGGIARSGTTLFQNAIDSHSRILGLPEFKNLHRIINLHKQMSHEIRKGFIDLICNQQELDAYFKDFILSFFRPLRDKYDCEFISEKTPQNLLVFADLIRLFPKAHFVLVVRDPRAIVNSTKNVRARARKNELESPVGSFFEFTHQIKNQYKLTVDLVEKYKDHIFLVRYADMVKDLEKVTKDFCEYMAIPWEPAMTHPGAKQHMNERGMTTGFNQAFYDKKLLRRDAESSSLDKWKQDLSKREINYINLQFKKEGLDNKFGYELADEDLSIFDHVYSFARNSRDKLIRMYYLSLRYAHKFSRI
jgi:hypothetical protein